MMFNFKSQTNREDGAAIILGLMMGLVGFALAFVMLLATIQSINTASAITVNNRLKAATETGINDALYLINSGYDFTLNNKSNPYLGEDRVIQTEGNETSAIKWKWWVEPMDLTTKEECIKNGGPANSYFECGYYIYSEATMPDLSEESKLLARAILLPMEVKSGSASADGGITYQSTGLSTLRNGMFGVESFNVGSGVGLYSFAAVEDPSVKKPTTPAEILEGYDGLPTDPLLSTQKVSVGSNKNVIINTSKVSNEDVSAYNLYRNGPIAGGMASYAGCSINSSDCAKDKINQQSFAVDLTAQNTWAATFPECASPKTPATFTSSSQIPIGVTCVQGDVTLDSNPVAGTKLQPSILVVKGNLTIAPNAKINPYNVPESLQIYVVDGDVSTATAPAAVTKVVGELVASGSGKGKINLSTGYANSKFKFYGTLVGNEINALGNVELWQDTNSKFIKNVGEGHQTVYQMFSYEVISATRANGLDNDFLGGQYEKGKAPSKVQNLNVVPKNDGKSAVLSWEAPADNGGTSDIEYTVEVSEDGFNWNTLTTQSKTSYTFTGLNKYTIYNARVKVTNAYGSSDWNVTTFLTKATIPNPPTNVISSGITSSGATLNWLAPSDTGGKPITMYKIIYSTQSDFSTGITLTGTAAPNFTLTGLNRATPYYVRVLSWNEEGQSTAYATASFTTLQTPAGPPTVNDVTTTNNSATITWTAPEDNGGSNLTGYNVYRDGVIANTSMIPASTFTYTVTGLAPEVSSVYTVVAINAVGSGTPSAGFTAVTKPNVPLAPKSLVINSYTGTGANISWTNGGGTVSRYVAYINGANNFQTANGSTTSGTLTGLTAGTSYTLSIYAWNVTGYSPAFTMTFYMQPNAPASSPTTNLGATPYLVNGSATFTFNSNPCYAGTTPTYRLYRSGVSTPVATTTATSVGITVPSSASTYTYYYTVSCAYGSYTTSEGASSPLTTVNVMNSPAAPSGVWVSSQFRNTSTICWNAVSGANSYSVYLNGGGGWTTTGTCYTISGVWPNNSYTASVRTNISIYQSGNANTTIDMPMTYLGTGGCISAGSWWDQRRGYNLVSGNVNYTLVVQGDGNMVLYNVSSGSGNWYRQTNSTGSGGWYLCMQGDGNLVLYRSNWTAVRATGNLGGSGWSLNLQDDSNLVVYSSAGAVWAVTWGTAFMS